MGDYDWDALFERIEEGMTTAEDVDVVRDLLEENVDLRIELAKFTDDEPFETDGE